MSDSNFSGNWINKFGRCSAVGSGDTVDVYDNGATLGAYPWPSAAAETAIVSGEAADTAAGTGARTVEVQGLDANYVKAVERVSMSGATPVTLTTAFLRVFRAKVLTAGSGGTNAGAISIKHGSSVIAMITAGYGQTLMAVYTIPDGFIGRMAGWNGNIKVSNSGVQSFRIDARPYGGAWNCKETFELGGYSGADFARVFSGWKKFSARTDIRIRVYDGSDNGTKVSAGFDMLLARGA